MCYHKRQVYICGHFGWGPEVRPCAAQNAAQQDFREGKISKQCDIMFAHPAQSIKLQILCQNCENKKMKTEGTMSKVKLAMKQLNDSISRLKAGEARDADVPVVSPVSPVEK